jgi:hypothetical protein
VLPPENPDREEEEKEKDKKKNTLIFLDAEINQEEQKGA